MLLVLEKKSEGRSAKSPIGWVSPMRMFRTRSTSPMVSTYSARGSDARMGSTSSEIFAADGVGPALLVGAAR